MLAVFLGLPRQRELREVALRLTLVQRQAVSLRQSLEHRGEIGERQRDLAQTDHRQRVRLARGLAGCDNRRSRVARIGDDLAQLQAVTERIKKVQPEIVELLVAQVDFLPVDTVRIECQFCSFPSPNWDLQREMHVRTASSAKGR